MYEKRRGLSSSSSSSSSSLSADGALCSRRTGRGGGGGGIRSVVLAANAEDEPFGSLLSRTMAAGEHPYRRAMPWSVSVGCKVWERGDASSGAVDVSAAVAAAAVALLALAAAEAVTGRAAIRAWRSTAFSSRARRSCASSAL